MFQIFTEDKNRNKVIRVLHKHLKGYTLSFGQGMWRGKEEACITAQFTGVDASVAHQIAKEIGVVNSQDSVMLIEHQTKV